MRWRTYVRAFNHGLMLTGLPVLAFLAVDYLVAPPAGSGKDAARVAPAPDSGVAKFVPASSGLDRQAAAADDASEAQSIAPTAFKSLIKSAVGNVASGGRSSLVTSIQEELQRVGCFAGDVDGTWSERTKSAMQAFNASVHVSLPTDRPDYIHLTLLQGHSSKACARSCERDVCVDRSIEARAVAPASPATDGRTVQSNGEARLSSAVVPTPVVMQRSPAASTVVHVAPSQAAAGSAASRRGVDTKIFGPAPVAVGEPVAREGVASSAPLPGRMAIGARGASDAQPGDDHAASVAMPVVVDHAAKAKPVPTRPRPGFATESGWRANRTFTDLGRSSP